MQLIQLDKGEEKKLKRKGKITDNHTEIKYF